jgi:hypothetical protein
VFHGDGELVGRNTCTVLHRHLVAVEVAGAHPRAASSGNHETAIAMDEERGLGRPSARVD